LTCDLPHFLRQWAWHPWKPRGRFLHMWRWKLQHFFKHKTSCHAQTPSKTVSAHFMGIHWISRHWSGSSFVICYACCCCAKSSKTLCSTQCVSAQCGTEKARFAETAWVELTG
jgi:hypothetical protein